MVSVSELIIFKDTDLLTAVSIGLKVTFFFKQVYTAILQLTAMVYDDLHEIWVLRDL